MGWLRHSKNGWASNKRMFNAATHPLSKFLPVSRYECHTRDMISTPNAYAHQLIFWSAGSMLQICHEKAQAMLAHSKDYYAAIGRPGGEWALDEFQATV